MTRLFKIHKNLLIELTILSAAAFSVIYGKINVFMLILSVCVHELGHVTVSLMTGAKTNNIRLHGFGVEITFPGKNPSAKKMLIISSGGPIASFILSLIGYYLNHFMLFSINLSIAVINLIPAYPLDGGNILYSLLSNLIPRKTLRNIMAVLGKTFGILITLFGLLVLFVSGFNISMIYMGLFVFFSSGRTLNPVVEILSTEQAKVEKCSLFLIDSTLSPIEAAMQLPVNSIGAIKKETGEITSLVTPRFLYNNEIKKNHP